MSVSERVAIAGVTGYIGGRLAPRLLEHGYAIRCLVRSPAKLQNRPWATDPNVQIRLADLADETSLTRELEGCQAAYYLVHSMMSAGSDYAEHDHQLALTFARAAKNAGVKRIIYLGGLGETGPDLSEHLSSRREVEEALASTGVAVTVLRAAMIIGSGSASFEILRYLVERLPVMVTPKWVSTPCQPIAVRNVIGYLVGVLAVPETAGGVFDIGGPDVFCYRDIMRIMAEELGLRRRLIIPVPVLTPRLSSYWIQLITPSATPLRARWRKDLRIQWYVGTIALPVSFPRNFSASAKPYTRLSTRWLNTTWKPVGRWLVPFQATQIGLAEPSSVTFGRSPWKHLRGRSFDPCAGLAVGTVGTPPIFSGRSADGWTNWLAARGCDEGEGIQKSSDTERRWTSGASWVSSATAAWRLRAEMKLPGEALLEFRIEALNDRQCVLRQSALFRPRGLFGLAYWYSVLPFHAIVFRGMLKGIEREALKIAASPQNMVSESST